MQPFKVAGFWVETFGNVIPFQTLLILAVLRFFVLLKNNDVNAEKKEKMLEKLMSMDAEKFAAIVKLLE